MRECRRGIEKSEILHTTEVSSAAGKLEGHRVSSACAADAAIRVRISLRSAGDWNGTRSDQCSVGAIEVNLNTASESRTGDPGDAGVHSAQIDIIEARPIAA